MWLAALNLSLMAGVAALYGLAHRGMLRERGRSSFLGLVASALVCLLITGGFATAHLGINDSWTGRASISDLHWLTVSAAFSGSLGLAHVFLRAHRQVDQLLLPVAALLVGLGLINIYVWEVRDANAYISTVALPELRAYEESIVRDPALTASQREQVISTLGQIPNELSYEIDADGFATGRSATVFAADWLESYQESVEQYQASLGEYRSIASPPLYAASQAAGTADDRTASQFERPIYSVQLYDRLHTQLFAAAAGFLLVPLALVLFSRFSGMASTAARWPALAAGSFLVAVSGAAFLTGQGSAVPAMVPVGDRMLVAYDLLKFGLVIMLVVLLRHLLEHRDARRDLVLPLGIAAAGLSIGFITSLDFGAGLALLAICGLTAAPLIGGRWRSSLIVAGVVVILCLPVAVFHADSSLPFPGALRERVAMWIEPWGQHQNAQVENHSSRSLERLISQQMASRPKAEASERVESSPSVSPEVALLEADVEHIIQEWRWRLDGLGGAALAGANEPFVPNDDPNQELVLLEAERLWSELGGYQLSGSDDAAADFQQTLDEAALNLRSLAEDWSSKAEQEGGVDASSGVVPRGVEPDSFQLQRGWYALRAGGLFGVGLGAGRPEAIPDLTEDMALVALGEAWGFAGAALVTLFLLLIVSSGIERSRRIGSSTNALLLLGMSTMLGLQALINMGGVSGMLPFTGLPYPLISRSGTSLVVSLAALAVVLAASRGVSNRAVAGASGDQHTARSPGRSARSAGALLLRGLGFPAAFILLLISIGLLQLTGRSMSPGLLFAGLPGENARFLHARDQWQQPDYRIEAGPIQDRDGETLATTRFLGEERSYPDEEVATSLGHSLMRLDGTFRDAIRAPSADGPRVPIGATLATTIDSEIQVAVHQAIDRGAIGAGLPDIERLRGAVVVLDVTSGDILASESRPSFSLGELSVPTEWAKAEGRERRDGFAYRYLNRVIDGYYPPGSILKTITAAGALEEGVHTLESRDFDYRSGPEGPRPPGPLVASGSIAQPGWWHRLVLPDGPEITDGNHPHLHPTDWVFNLEEAFAWSCNIVFAQLGLELGGPKLIDIARRFGFESPIVVDGLGTSTSTLDDGPELKPSARYLSKTASNLARTAFGQGQAKVTPLQMASVVAAIANDGKLMQPRIVAGWKSADGSWLKRQAPSVLIDTRLKPETLDQLQRMMQASATYGWASSAKVNPPNANPGVAGKTGSAEWSDELDAPHAWFIGYYPAESPRIALAVLIERGVAGPTVSVQVAHQIFASEAVQKYVREENEQ